MLLVTGKFELVTKDPFEANDTVKLSWVVPGLETHDRITDELSFLFPVNEVAGRGAVAPVKNDPKVSEDT